MKVTFSLLAFFVGCILTASLFGQSVDINVGSASAAGDLGNPGNTVLTGSFTDSFTARSLTWSGSLTSTPNVFFFEEDVFASIEGPNGLGYTGPVAGEQGIFLGTTPFSGWYANFTPASVAGDWRFEAYTANSIANSTNWTMQDSVFSFNSDLFPQATSIAVGSNVSAAITESEILWYSLQHAGGQLFISTAGSVIEELDGNIQTDDTILAVYDSLGQLVDFNDDVGNGDFTSFLSFSNLSAGEYRIAVAGATFGTRVGNAFISSSHDGVGTIQLSVSAIPEPSSVAILTCFGLFAGIRRRKKQLNCAE